MSETWREEALVACRLLGDARRGRRVEAAALPPEAVLFGFARAHRMVTILSSALHACGIPADAYAALHDAAQTAAFHQIKNDLLSDTVLRRLSAAGVEAVPLKGAAIQAVYPDGWIRTATDTDVYVDKAQATAAETVLTAMGFEKSGEHDGDACFRKPPRSVVELHTTLGGYSKSQRQALDRLAHTPFTVNEQYVYTLFHLYKHVVYAGAGVRMFWDMYCLSDAVTDRPSVDRWLEELSLTAFDRAVQTMGGVLFDGDEAEGAMNEAVDLVLLSGAFGTGETYHAMKHVARPITRQNRARAWVQDYGFDRKAMCERYPVLVKHGWLYPVCAVRRVMHGVTFKRTVLKRATQTAYAADRKQIDRVLRAMRIL